MFEIVLALICIGIAIKAVRQVRRDPRFTPRVILRHLLGILLYFLFAGLLGYAVVKLGSSSFLSGLSVDVRAAVLTISFLISVIAALLILLRYLKKVFEQKQTWTCPDSMDG